MPDTIRKPIRRRWMRLKSMPIFQTTVIASATSVIPISMCIPLNPIHSGIKQGRPKNPPVSSQPTFIWQMTIRIVFALRANGSMAMDQIAPSMAMLPGNSAEPSRIAYLACDARNICTLPTRRKSGRLLSSRANGIRRKITSTG